MSYELKGHDEWKTTPPDEPDSRECDTCDASGKVCTWCEESKGDCECKLGEKEVAEGVTEDDFDERHADCHRCEGTGWRTVTADDYFDG